MKTNIDDFAYYTPVNESTRELLWKSFCLGADSGSDLTENFSIPVMMNRSFTIPFARGNSCFLEFSDLCEQERSAADFKALCEHFDKIYVHGIPTMSVLKHDHARRFITLIDELYDAKVHVTSVIH